LPVILSEVSNANEVEWISDSFAQAKPVPVLRRAERFPFDEDAARRFSAEQSHQTSLPLGEGKEG
jgi:hypothetical protein